MVVDDGDGKTKGEERERESRSKGDRQAQRVRASERVGGKESGTVVERR